MSRLAAARVFLRLNGAEAALRRARYEFALRSGWERWRRPATSWDAATKRLAAVLPRHGPPRTWLDHILPTARPPLPPGNAAAAARRVAGDAGLLLPQHGGRVVPWSEVFTTHDTAPHWTQIHEFARADDIRTTWEPARLGWVWLLARGSHDDPALARQAWDGACRWMTANPPMHGPHWHSGQEAAVRLIALTWAFVAAVDHLPQTAARELTLWASVIGERIAGRLEYAISQNNNHSVTEAVGLLYAATITPSHPGAAGWRRRATRVLAADVTRQVFGDGSYVQESVVYHRIALEALLAVAWLERAGAPGVASAADTVRQPALRMLGHLHALTDPASGELARLGANDGSWLMFAADHDFWDAAPTTAFAAAVLSEPPPPAANPVYVWTARDDNNLTLFKSGRIGARPTEPDALHVEHRVEGRILLRDAGSFRYLGPPGLDTLFRSAQAHNTVVVDGREPVRRMVRFLWDRPQTAHFTHFASDGRLHFATAVHPALGADRQATVTRTVCRLGTALIVVDRVRADRAVHAMLSWHLDPQWDVTERTPTSARLRHADGKGIRMGWWNTDGTPTISEEWSLSSGWYTACSLGPAIRVELRAVTPTIVTVFDEEASEWDCAFDGPDLTARGPLGTIYATETSVRVT